MNKIRVEQFLSEFGRWAANQTYIQAVALVGSYARGTATELSDLDIIVVANRPDLYLQERTWVETFGDVVNQQIENYGKLVSIRVQHADMLEVEYGVTDVNWLALHYANEIEPSDRGGRKIATAILRLVKCHRFVDKRTAVFF